MKTTKAAAYPYVLWLILFTAIPMLIVFYYAFTNEAGSFTLMNFKDMADYSIVFFNSFRLAIISTLICLVLGYPMAYAMSKLGRRGRTAAMIMIMVPMWMNFLLRTYAWLTILENNGLLNAFLSAVHMPELHIINTPAAVGIGMVYNYLPFMILPIYNSLEAIDNSLIEAARDMGCSSSQVFTKVVLPLSIPGTVSGIIMVFIPAVSTFVISKILGGGASILIGDLIEMQFLGGTYDANMGAAISLVMMVIITLFTMITNKIDKDNDEGSVLMS
ncbi:MAG: ABC transporter permease [Eubacteriales bacterium]|nr:ABC transporter permease [Eubacteriales bacterium]